MSQSLSNLPIGAKVKFGSHSIYEETAQPIQWLVVTKNTTSNGVNSRPANSVTLYARYVIDCRAFDAKEPNNPNSNRQSYGNNRYIYSNIAQWLNSSAERGKWYSPQHTYDNSPNSLCVDRSAEYDWKEGFLYNFTESERNAILLTTIATTKSSSDGSGDDISTAKVFLPSYSREIAQWDYTTGGGDITSKLSQQVKDYSKATTRHETSWTRDARVSTTDKVDILGVDGKLGTGGVGAEAYCSVWGVRPVLNLPANQVVSDTTDSDGCYTVIFNKLPIASGMYATTTSVNALLGGKANKFSLTAYDSDGAVIRYEVECLDNGVWKNKIGRASCRERVCLSV